MSDATSPYDCTCVTSSLLLIFLTITLPIHDRYFIGYYPYLMITDPEAIREVLVKKFDHFKSRGVSEHAYVH